ncbi:GATA zinc finger domain-containing protein 14-like isoform X9 [Anopheles gambiae]|uniref:GATA zinc finger domain-containing protein 14-like isoform X9 n=1 Tax=Anopheles gambiae TaxID=7165 RepID=UPI002AC8EC56|nr:GATA zinc finger domain-containing protein 14-like isoform X9 [Anopheles gambiae]XP_061519059.1 GATA zinc finger domain-containing protein 14-like isoform X9 [Anopheles gambiae]XP_061519060.1 GATA zinc finger domain-containing protein 14-like isoform X9 [Anopheles gambiae]XP_061519062.1 GATA zinc finger domain-containing protein 14-like isoform X9 [Anopheles gambiae]
MWNKLFKSKSKSSKNLSNRSCSSGLETSSPKPGPSKSTSNGLNLVSQYEQYGSSFEDMPEPVRMRMRPDTHDSNVLDLASATNHRDSIGVEMCGIPMRRSKLSSAFKSLSLKRNASKSRLKLVTSPEEISSVPGSDGYPEGPPKKDLNDYEILSASKRASLRPCKSDNNLNEKQLYTEAEKEEPVYIEECKSYETFDPSYEPPPNLELQPCPICLRKFAPASLSKHTGICERVQTKKRKPFDSSRQRREGTELASYLPKNFGLPQKTAIPVRKLSLSKTPTFERKEFSPTTMSTSMPSASTPKPALKRSMSQQNEPCPYCERCFGMKAYDRHVEWCREKAILNRNVNNNQSISAAKERLQARIQYKAPQIRSKRALNREKYSGSLSCSGSTNSLAELDLHMPRHNSMSSSVSSDNGYSPDRYDPFLSARRQLEELFSPATSLIHTSSPSSTTSTSRLNQMSPNGGTANDKSASGNATKHTPHNSNFRRAYSLRMPRKVSRPMYVEKAKSNIQKGITDDGPVSPNFLKSSEYDELPIKSTFNALQMAEPKPKLRDSSTVRKNLKLEIRDPNNPAGGEIPLSKTDSLAVFLKYENELALSEKDMKDKSNSLSKRTSSLSAEVNQQKKQEVLSVAPSPVKANETITVDEEQQKHKKNVQAIEDETAKKQTQKLVPIKLEPINITYNSNNASEVTDIKPVVISLDAIIGKPSIKKQKEPQVDSDNRADNSYIDPKLINKCDNLPINLVMPSTKDADGSCSSRNSNTIGNICSDGNQLALKTIEPKVERSAVISPPPRASLSVAPKPPERTRNETCFDYRKSNNEPSSSEPSTSNNSSPTTSHSSSPVDHRISKNSTNCDKRPQLNRQDREDSGYRTGQESGQSDVHEQPKKPSPSPSASKNNEDNMPKNPAFKPTYKLNRLISPSSALNNFSNTLPSSNSTAPSTPVNRDRPTISSALEQFDVDEFMQSLEDLHRQSPISAREYKHSLFVHSNSSVTSRSVASSQSDHTNNNKRSNSLDSGHGNSVANSIRYVRKHESSGVPRMDVCVRNGSGTASNNNSSNSSSSFSSPSHYSNSNNSNSYYNSSSTNNNNSHNHSTSASNANDAAKCAEVVHPLGQQMNYARNSPAIAHRRRSEDAAGISLPAVPPLPSSNTGGSGALSSLQNLPNIHKATAADTLLNGNNKTMQQPGTLPYYSSPSPVNGRKNSYSNKSYHANNTGTSASTPASSHLTGNVHEPRYPAESFDHLERDLLKSVQELNRMCGSSSSVCSIDSEELYSVEDYPLNKRSSERSQASADSAYRSSLSTQSPPDYAPPVPIRQARPNSRSSTTSQSQPAQSTNEPFNSLSLHTALPPITTAIIKGHRMEAHLMKDSPEGGPNLIMNPMSKFCHECGARFMISSAKFCMSCGVRRIMLD